MDIQRLRTYRSVVATGSIRAAAQALDFSPSSVSQQVAALQKETGLQLLSRSGRGIEPTAEGRELARRIDDLLEELGQFDQFVNDRRAGRNQSFSLGYFASLGTTVLPQLVGRLAREFPDTSLRLQLLDEFDPAARPRLDLQVAVEHKNFIPPAGFTSQRLASDPYMVAMPADHRLSRLAAVPLPELAEERWVDNDFAQGWCRRIILEACATVGFRPIYRVEAHDYATALAMVGQDLGITVVPRIATHSLPTGVIALPVVEPVPVRHIHAITSTDAQQSAVTRRAQELLGEAFSASDQLLR